MHAHRQHFQFSRQSRINGHQRLGLRLDGVKVHEGNAQLLGQAGQHRILIDDALFNQDIPDALALRLLLLDQRGIKIFLRDQTRLNQHLPDMQPLAGPSLKALDNLLDRLPRGEPLLDDDIAHALVLQPVLLGNGLFDPRPTQITRFLQKLAKRLGQLAAKHIARDEKDALYARKVLRIRITEKAIDLRLLRIGQHRIPCPASQRHLLVDIIGQAPELARCLRSFMQEQDALDALQRNLLNIALFIDEIEIDGILMERPRQTTLALLAIVQAHDDRHPVLLHARSLPLGRLMHPSWPARSVPETSEKAPGTLACVANPVCKGECR